MCIGKLYFSSNDSDWSLAFENLPSEILYPALSLYQRDDKVILFTSTSSKTKTNKNIYSKSDTIEGNETSFIAYFRYMSNTVLSMLDTYNTTNVHIFAHPFITFFLPSLAAAIIKCDFKSHFVKSSFQFLPLLVRLTRRLSAVYEGVEDAEQIGSVGLIDGLWYTHICIHIYIQLFNTYHV